MRPGDTLLLETHKRFVDAYRNSGDFYLVSTVGASRPIRHERAWLSLAILGLLVCLLTFTNIPPVAVALSCALGAILTGCVTPTVARNSIDWQVLIVIACALGIGAALQATGVAQYITGQILAFCRGIDLGPHAMLLVIFLLSTGFAQLITNNGAAVLMFPHYCPAIAFGLDDNLFYFKDMNGF